MIRSFSFFPILLLLMILQFSASVFGMETELLSSETPVITRVSVPESINRGENATFAVWAEGGNLTYQWWCNDAPLADNGMVCGAVSNKLVLTSVGCQDNNKMIWCVVSNGAGSVVSEKYILTVNHVYDQNVQNDSTLVQKASCKARGIYYSSCLCGDVGNEMIYTDMLPHSGGTATCKEQAHCAECGQIYGEYGPHSFEQWQYNAAEHWMQCSVCDMKQDVSVHEPGDDATEDQPQLCIVCGYEIVAALGHLPGEEWFADEQNHWQLCVRCEEPIHVSAHEPGETVAEDPPQFCKVCGREIAPSSGHLHSLMPVAALEATCTESGRKAHYSCTCGKIFADAEGKTEITDPSVLDVMPLGHSGGKADCTCLALCQRCQCFYGDYGEHDYSLQNYDELAHWQECVVCGDKEDMQPHRGGIASCTTLAQCAICSQAYGDKIPHVYNEMTVTAQYLSAEATCSASSLYYYSCKCGAVGTETFALGEKRPHNRQIQKYDNDKHRYICKNCGEVQGIENHSFVKAVTSSKYKEIYRCICGAEKVVLSHPFEDVKTTDWFFEDVVFVYHEELLRGMKENLFGAQTETSRAMIVTILYRLEGEPEIGSDIFRDVAAAHWYGNAVFWAAKIGVVEGYGNGTFGPNDPVTREQIASILHRYAVYKGFDVSSLASLSSFPDDGDVSNWAKTPLSWAVAQGLIGGASENGTAYLRPKNNALRCQIAAILHRFCVMQKK